jgi:dTDP-glucose 4,6-dehydratase
MKRVLLTGASGLVGSHVLQYFLDHTDWDIVCLSSWRHKGNPMRLQKYADNERVEIISHDLIGPLPDLGKFDYILNLASESHVDRSITDPVPFVLNNVALMLNMLEYARKYPPELFIQFSTDEVFGHTEVISDVLWPSNPYAASKASQEVLVSAYRKTYNLQAVVTNSNNIIGEGQDPEKYVAKLAQQIANDETVMVHAQEGRLGQRRYNPVENVGAALLFLIRNYEPQPPLAPTPRFGLTGGQELDNLQIAELVAKVMGKKLKYEIIDVHEVRPGYDERYPKVNTKLEEMGFVPPISLEEGLQWLKLT